MYTGPEKNNPPERDSFFNWEKLDPFFECALLFVGTSRGVNPQRFHCLAKIKATELVEKQKTNKK